MSAIKDHRLATKRLARSLRKADIYHWLVTYGYFPESYVLPPCFKVKKRPTRPKLYFPVTKKGGALSVTPSQCVNFHFPKSELTDRTFGVMNPEIHNDIAFHISRNWMRIVDALLPEDSAVTSYSFPIPIDSRNPGRVGYLRSGRMIYEFLTMTDDDIASVAYKYTHLVRADIKSFYPSIYTHSIAWALHGKAFIRKPGNFHDYNLLGNRLDRLFQYSNDRCTNGLPIGPVVSDVASEVIAAAVDRLLTKKLAELSIEYEAVRFKDDYRILVKSENDAKCVVKCLQSALKAYNLELSDEKTSVSTLPDGLFRGWVSRYHAAYPSKLRSFSWKQFRELYLAVIAIEREFPGTGVIDRFLADIVTKRGSLKVVIGDFNLEKAVSMLLMLGTLRIKAFPKVMAILENVIASPFGRIHQKSIVEYLEMYLMRLSVEEERNKYLITWISYFLVSNGLTRLMTIRPKFKDPIPRSTFSNRGALFKSCLDFRLFEGCATVRKQLSMFEHLNVFDPPRPA